MEAETTLTEKMRAALRISSTSDRITEEINDCMIVRAITLYVKAEFGFNGNADKFHNSYESLKVHLSMSSEYNTVSETDTGTETEGAENGSMGG